MTEAFKRGYALRKGRVSLANQAYSITMVTAHRENLFSNFHMGRIVVDHLRKAGDSCLTIAFVVMPDHCHWLIQLNGSKSLSAIIKQVKGGAALEINRYLNRTGNKIWQPGFYDHALRCDEDLRAAARYIIANPIRAGLVNDIGQYALWDAVYL